MRLDLAHPRDLADLVFDSVRLWLRHLPVFLSLAAVVVAPVELLLARTAWKDDPTMVVAYLLCTLVLVPSLVTAMHVVAVQDLGEGRRPTFRRSAGEALRVAPAVLAAVALYLLSVAVGSLLLVAPGLVAMVIFFFAPQAVVVDGCRPVDSLRRSRLVVGPHFARVFLFAIVLGTIAGVATRAIEALLPLGEVVDTIVGASIAVSLTALSATLLFFDLRARNA